MATRFLIAVVASMAFGAQAGPIVFTSQTSDTVAFAVAGSVADAHSDTNPPTALPLVTTATAVDTNDFATSFALAAPGLLSTFAEADSFPGALGAFTGAQAHFNGSFTGAGPIKLDLKYDSLDSLLGGGSSSSQLFVLLSNSAAGTLFNGPLLPNGLNHLQFNVLGGISTLDLVLFSDATTTAAGQSGQNFSQVTFGGTIPLPATPFLVVAGLGAMLAARRKNAKATA